MENHLANFQNILIRLQQIIAFEEKKYEQIMLEFSSLKLLQWPRPYFDFLRKE